MRRAEGIAAAVLAALWAGLAAAPAEACSVSTSGINFGTYDPRSATPLDGAGSVQLDCHSSSRPTLSISTGSSGTFVQRRMNNGGSTLGYNLYTTAARTAIWGDGTGGTAVVNAPRRVSSTPIYGRIPAGQNVTAGRYGDTLVVTVSW